MGMKLPANWVEAVYDAFVDVQKYALTVSGIVLPWAWHTEWEAIASDPDVRLLFNVDVHFAMIDKPIALIKR